MIPSSRHQHARWRQYESSRDECEYTQLVKSAYVTGALPHGSKQNCAVHSARYVDVAFQYNDNPIWIGQVVDRAAFGSWYQATAPKELSVAPSWAHVFQRIAQIWCRLWLQRKSSWTRCGQKFIYVGWLTETRLAVKTGKEAAGISPMLCSSTSILLRRLAMKAVPFLLHHSVLLTVLIGGATATLWASDKSDESMSPEVRAAPCGAAPVLDDPFGHQCDQSNSCQACFFAGEDCWGCTKNASYKLCGTPAAIVCSNSSFTFDCGNAKKFQAAGSAGECTTCVGSGTNGGDCTKNTCEDPNGG